MEISEIKKYILKNVYSGLVKTSLTFLLSIIAVPLLISKIGLDTFGVISIVPIFSSFTGVLDLGLSKALIIFEGEGKSNQEEISSIYIINLFLFGIVLIFGGAVFLFDINLMGSNLDLNNTTLGWLNFIAVLLLAFGILNNLLRASLEAHFKLQLVNWGFLIQSFILNLGWLFLALANADIIYFLFIPLLSSIVTIIYYLFFLPPIYSILKRPSIKSLKNVFSITFQFFKVGALNSVHLPLIKYSIILFLGDAKAIGIFELSTKLSVLANNLLAYVSTPFFSIASKNQVAGREYLWGIIKKVTMMLSSIVIVGYLVFLFLEEQIILYFYKDYSSQIFWVLNVTIIGSLFIAASESVQKFFLGIGRINLVANVKLLGVIVNCIILFFLFIYESFNLLNISISFALSLVIIGSFWLIIALKKGSKIISE